MNGKETKLYSSQLTLEEHRLFNDVARYRGQTKAGILRGWIRNSHKQMPEEAKTDSKVA